MNSGTDLRHRIKEWMARSSSGITRSGASNPPLQRVQNEAEDVQKTLGFGSNLTFLCWGILHQYCVKKIGRKSGKLYSIKDEHTRNGIELLGVGTRIQQLRIPEQAYVAESKLEDDLTPNTEVAHRRSCWLVARFTTQLVGVGIFDVLLRRAVIL